MFPWFFVTSATWGTLLISVALILALMAASDALGLARSPLAPLAPLPSDLATLAVELRLALFEPGFSVGALLVLLISGLTGGLPALCVALGSLAWIVGLPLRGHPIQDPDLRRLRGHLLRLSLARWATLVAPAALWPEGWTLLSFLGMALLWRTVAWSGRQLNTTLLPPRPRAAAAPTPPPRTVAPPPAVPAPPSPAERLLREAPAGPPLPCSGCGTAVSLREAICPQCGLLFASQVPAALANLADTGYHVVRPLGAGGMSAVFLAYDRSARDWCCVKTIVSVDPAGDTVWRSQAAASLAREVSVLVELDHPGVSRARDWLDDPARPCLILELVPGASLEQRLAAQRGAGLPHRTVCAWGQEVAAVLGYLAERETPIAHGDIKPDNLLLAEGSARPTLVDFGSAARLQRGGPVLQPHDAYGTPGYAAPELYRGHIGLASDVYGLGATLYHLLTGDDPTLHPLQFPALLTLPAELSALLGAMLQGEPAARPTPADVAARLASQLG